MALPPVADQLRQAVLRFDPQDPIWPNRDRFVLSVRIEHRAAIGLVRQTGGGDLAAIAFRKAKPS